MSTKKRIHFEEPKKEIKKEVKKETKKITKWIGNFDSLRKKDVGKHSSPEKKNIFKVKNDTTSPREFVPTLKKIRLFDYRQMCYKNQFKNSPIFNWNCKDAYRRIDHYYRTLVRLEEEEETLLKRANLQELYFPENLPLKVVRRELKQMKIMWDYINLVKTYLKQLKRAEWDEYTLEELETQLRNFKVELNKLVDINGCDAFAQLMAHINQVLHCIYNVPTLGENLFKEMIEAIKVRDQEEQKKSMSSEKSSKIYT